MWRDARGRFPDPSGRIWCILVLLFTAVMLRWQERWLWRRWMPSFSINKAPLFFLLRLPTLMLFRGIRRLPEPLSVELPRWWCGGWVSIGEASSNKRDLLRRCGILLLVLPILTSHGGVARIWPPATTCSDGGVGGFFNNHELIHDRGYTASATLCRQGGDIQTSDAEAFHLRRGCSKLPCHEVISSPWLGSGPWRRINAGRELPSNWLLILGGDASRTPADSGRDTWGLDCSRFSSSRVVFVKTKVLSSNSRFVRARDARTFVKLYLPRYE
jgi:hypothetical protein